MIQRVNLKKKNLMRILYKDVKIYFNKKECVCIIRLLYMSFLEGMNMFNCACLKQINIEKNICLSYNNVKPNKNSKI